LRCLELNLELMRYHSWCFEDVEIKGEDVKKLTKSGLFEA